MANLNDMEDSLLESSTILKDIVQINRDIKELMFDIQENIDESRADMNDTTVCDDCDYHEGRVDAYEIVLERLRSIFS